MTYQKLQQLTEGLPLPLAGKNEHGENVIIELGSSCDNPFFKLITSQYNGWTRINLIYEDGSSDEFYRR